MRLKKIEVQGFKSFADKIKIVFKDGITAIVGPNGSGKSNISDAIRWVLGEQSVKTLRGSKMQDIIFAGTSKRKPVGYTEVTISFDNKSGKIPLEYEEVAITRRMFRSGESEYYLNKNSCRLRDIRELFMDTGVGKDGYSIIGQGRIDEILSNRPEDRRSIFEEAAGIVKFKSKKEEAEKKLKKTESNLLRLKDLLFELTKQEESLKDQSKKASYFSKLFNELKELEVNIYLNNIEESKMDIEKINNEILKTEKILKLSRSDKENIDIKFTKLKENTEKQDLEIEHYRKEEMNSLSEIEKNKNTINILQEKKNFNLRDLERLKKEKDNLSLNLKNLEKENHKNKEYIISNEDKYKDSLKEYKSKSEELKLIIDKIKELEKELELGKNNIIKLYNNSSDKRSKLNSIVAFNDNIEKRTSQLDKKINEMINERKSKFNILEDLEKTEKNLKDKKSFMEKEFKSLKAIENKNLEKEESINKKINGTRVDLQGKSSSLNLFKNMERSYEGYYRGVKSVLQASKTNSLIENGLVGVVADLIKLDEKYEKAIDVALGSNAQNIVTKTEEDAKNIIEYLKKNKLGRITCLPLNVIRGRKLKFDLNTRKEFKIIGLACEIIEYDINHDEIFKSLLGRTVIVENIDDGIRLANKYNHSHRIVTLAGEVLNPGGSMTGGSYSGNSTGIISRKNRIEKLEKEIQESEEMQKKLIDEKHIIISEITKNKEKVKNIEEEIREKEYKIINTKNSKENQKLEIIRFDESINGFQDEIKTLKFEVGNYNIEKVKIKDSLIVLEDESKKAKERINTLNEQLSKEEDSKDKLNDIIIDMKIYLNKEENTISSLKERLNKIKLDIESGQVDLKEKEKLIVFNKSELESIEESKKDLEKSIENLKFLRNNNKIKLDKSLENKQKLMESFYLEQENLKIVNEEIGNMEKNINSNQVKLARLSVNLDNYYKKLEEDYELSYKEAQDWKKEKIDIEEDLKRIKKLKSEIKKIGSVNLSSIEEYEKIKTRLDFILGQENDLTRAKKDLRKVILDMEAKMKKQFLESFEIINENFKEIFSILFDGGKAELILEDKEDILKTGIEIKAQPPGKKLQNLSLLSGGEKSLTAVALLFSILKMKPAPFCVLDEIDAALDEANIGRYTNYLKEHCRDTQFIIITHRKATMEMADVLYGVTMEEEGISKLISVELKDNMDIIAS